MKEMILLFNPPAKEQLLKIRSALLPLHLRIQLIKPEQYLSLIHISQVRILSLRFILHFMEDFLFFIM